MASEDELEKKRAYYRAKAREYRAKLTPEQKAERAQKKREYNARNADRVKAYREVYEATHSRKKQKYEDNRRRLLKWKYKITVTELEMLTASNNQLCWACNKASNRALCVDHIDVDGEPIVRGILCWHCNVVLGLVKNDISILVALTAYLKREIDQELLQTLRLLATASIQVPDVL